MQPPPAKNTAAAPAAPARRDADLMRLPWQRASLWQESGMQGTGMLEGRGAPWPEESCTVKSLQ